MVWNSRFSSQTNKYLLTYIGLLVYKKDTQRRVLNKKYRVQQKLNIYSSCCSNIMVEVKLLFLQNCPIRSTEDKVFGKSYEYKLDWKIEVQI